MSISAPRSPLPLAQLLRRVWENNLEGEVYIQERELAPHRIAIIPGRIVSVAITGPGRGSLWADLPARFDEVMGRASRRGADTWFDPHPVAQRVDQDPHSLALLLGRRSARSTPAPRRRIGRADVDPVETRIPRFSMDHALLRALVERGST